MASDNKNNIEFEQELASLKNDVVKLVLNTLKEWNLYVQFRKHYTKWSMGRTALQSEFFSSVYMVSPFTPKMSKKREVRNVEEYLATFATFINSFTWCETPEGGYKWSSINEVCEQKTTKYLKKEIADENSKINKFKRKYGFNK